MSQRTRKARRILALQEQLHKASEWRLAGVRSELAENQRTQESLISTLADEILGPLLVDVASRRLRSASQEREQLSRVEAAREARAQEEGRRLKRAERMLENVRRQDDRAREKSDFDALLDRVAAAGEEEKDASLPTA